MQMASEKRDQEKPPAGERPKNSYLSSIIALVLGIGLAVAVSSVFQIVGWGGELASQTAGAASGAAPLLVDGVRQRRRRWSGTRQELVALTRGGGSYRPRLLVAGIFGFAVLFVDTLFGLVMFNLTQAVIRIAHGDPARFSLAYALIGGVLTVPAVLVATALLATAAGHRLGEHRRRWVLLGLGIYTLVRIAMVLASGPVTTLPGITPAAIVGGLLITVPVITGAAFVGTWRARRTQAVFNAATFFRRLPAEDQLATLALLGETVAATR
jgi:hypothetical protein